MRSTLLGAAFAESGQPGAVTKTILLVEDEAFLRKVTAEVLESAGYNVRIASNAAEAFEAYTRFGSVDLLLADIVMPGMSGRELAAKFQSLYPRAGILLMSGYPEQLTRCGSSACPATYLAKPFSSRMLLGKVREVLDANPPVLRAQLSPRCSSGNELRAEFHE